MKFSLISILGLAALAAAADDTSAPIPTHTLTPTEKCLFNCGDDICCKAACVDVPCPDNSMANDTVACVAKCPQKDAKEFAQCQQDCIKSYFWSGTASLPVQTQAPTTAPKTTVATVSTVVSTTASSSESAASSSTASADSNAVESTSSAHSTTDHTTKTSDSSEPTASETEAPTANSALTTGPIAASVLGAAGFVAAFFAL